MGLVCTYKIMKSPEIDTTVWDYYYYLLKKKKKLKGEKEENEVKKYNRCLDELCKPVSICFGFVPHL